MTFTTVNLILHDVGEVDIEDYVDNEGKFVGIGARAAEAIANRKAIHYVDEEGVETIIPFHAISAVGIAKNTDSYTKPEDEFCQPMECPTTPLCPSESDADDGDPDDGDPDDGDPDDGDPDDGEGGK